MEEKITLIDKKSPTPSPKHSHYRLTLKKSEIRQLYLKKYNQQLQRNKFSAFAKIIFTLFFFMLVLHFLMLNETFSNSRSATFLRRFKLFHMHHKNNQKFIFLNHIKLSSNFDSGNLAHAVAIKPYSFLLRVGNEKVIDQEGDYEVAKDGGFQLGEVNQGIRIQNVEEENGKGIDQKSISNQVIDNKEEELSAGKTELASKKGLGQTPNLERAKKMLKRRKIKRKTIRIEHKTNLSTHLSSIKSQMPKLSMFNPQKTLKKMNKHWFMFNPQKTLKKMNKHWFMFKMTKMDQPISLNFTITNISYSPGIMKNGLVPVVKREFDFEYTRVLGRIEILYNPRRDKDYLSINFHYTYDPIIDGKLFFAISYPYSYLKYVRKFKKLLRKYSEMPGVYFRRQRLTQTSDSRSLDIYWVTKLNGTNSEKPPQSQQKNGLKKKRVEVSKPNQEKQTILKRRDEQRREALDKLYNLRKLDFLTQEMKKSSSKNSKTNKTSESVKAFQRGANKKVIVVLARTHGSESLSTYSSTFMVKALLKSMNKKSLKYKKFSKILENKMFLFIPMANPDGVSRGFSIIDMSQNDQENEFLSSNRHNSPEMAKIRHFLNNLYSLKMLEQVIVLKSQLGIRSLKVSAPKLTPYTTKLQFQLKRRGKKIQINKTESPHLLNQIESVLPHTCILSFTFPSLQYFKSQRLVKSLVKHHKYKNGTLKTIVKKSKNGITLRTVRKLSEAILGSLQNLGNELKTDKPNSKPK